MNTEVLEISEFHPRPGMQDGLCAVLPEVMDLIRGAEGCLGATFYRSVERPDIYRLTVRWRALDDHTVAFRQSPAFPRLQALLGGLLTAPPSVEHYRDACPPGAIRQ